MSGASGVARPAEHRRPALIALVALGGAIGTGLRAVVTLLLPSLDGIPWSTAGVNVVGALALGALFGVLDRDAGGEDRQRVRLFVGTGILGGFTTYSALATDTVVMGGTGSAGTALAYGLGTVLAGAAATVAGLALGGRADRRPAR